MTAIGLRAVLFDMDGTLVHTAPDIAAALNAALCRSGLVPIEPARIADLIGRGARLLVRRALALQDADEDRLARLVLDDYLREYAYRIGCQGRAFEGAERCLHDLHARRLKLGVVTNALQRFAEATLAHYGLAKYLGVIVGGDRSAKQKPHPAPLWFACRTLGVVPGETLMIGDSAADVAAAHAAGCHVACVPHGYNEGRPSSELDCEMISALDALPAWIDAAAALRVQPQSAA